MKGITRGPLTLCPYCSHKLDAFADGSAQAPVEGDASVCIDCGGILFIQADMTPRKPKQGELLMIMVKDPQWYDQMIGMQQQIRSRGDL